MPARYLLFLGLCVCPVAGAAAAPRQVSLAPPDTAVAIRAYGMGLLPLDGTFARFRGSLTFDPADHSNCRVDLTIDVASLTMTNAAMRETMIGPDFMDAARFPTLTYSGTCQPQGISGMLALHGMTRPFQLSLAWSQDQVVAEGQLVRADWGMTAMPIVAGRTVRIRVAVPLAQPSLPVAPAPRE
jgi:polyisoprenoid-binding protein YceI